MSSTVSAPAAPLRSQLTDIRCLWFALAVIIGTGMGLLLAPTVFRALPTDMTRTRVLLDTLAAAGDDAPDMVLFGNSVAMASADMSRISSRLTGSPRGWNLASTGQSPQESFLFYQQVPAATGLVIQLIDPSTVTNWNALDEQKYNAFYMFGYRPDERTRAVMVNLLGSSMVTLFAKTDIEQRFASRWAIRQVTDRLARDLLRGDLDIDRATYDLNFPNSAAEPLPEAVVNRQMAARFDERPDEYYAKPAKLEFLGEMAARARAQGQQIVFVLAPVHPEQVRRRGAEFFAGARATFTRFAETYDVPVLDGIDIVPRAEFVDTTHPSEAGGATFSAWLGAELQRLELAGKVRL